MKIDLLFLLLYYMDFFSIIITIIIFFILFFVLFYISCCDVDNIDIDDTNDIELVIQHNTTLNNIILDNNL